MIAASLVGEPESWDEETLSRRREILLNGEFWPLGEPETPRAVVMDIRRGGLFGCGRGWPFATEAEKDWPFALAFGPVDDLEPKSSAIDERRRFGGAGVWGGELLDIVKLLFGRGLWRCSGQVGRSVGVLAREYGAEDSFYNEKL